MTEQFEALMHGVELVGLDELLNRPRWHADAACRDYDPKLTSKSQANGHCSVATLSAGTVGAEATEIPRSWATDLD